MATAYRLTLLSLCASAAAAVAYAQDTADTADTGAASTRGSIILTDPLNERADGEFYCLDIFGSTVEENDGMQVHTCKDRPRPAEDMDFTVDTPNLGNINVTQYDSLCVSTMRKAAVGQHLSVVACSSTDMRQQWMSDAAGEIHPASDTSLCLTVADTRMCGNPDCSNYKRTLTLQTCVGVDTKYNTWTIPGGSIGL